MCIFPFVYDGVTYCDCTEVDRDKPWCSLGVDDDQHYIGYWGYCNPNCFEGKYTEFGTK